MQRKAFLAFSCFLPLLSSCLFFGGGSLKTNDGQNAIYNVPTYGKGFSQANLNVRNVGASNGQYYMPHSGEADILVLPIQFRGDAFTATELERIENAFFGESSDTGWESVRSYYEKSSYGALEINGEVAPVFDLGLSIGEALLQYPNAAASFVEAVLDACLSSLSRQGEDFSRFDGDGDGFIDAVWMVYSVSQSSSNDIQWAFTSWATQLKDYGGYTVSSYSWASVDFLTVGGYLPRNSSTNADAHTFIHETGHLMGLDDYYSYDAGTDDNVDSPTGGAMMMDYNIGDHDAFSKYLLGWVDPRVVTKEEMERNQGGFTLSSFGETGDCLLIPIVKDGKEDYNGTPFDEYLIVEYYTPDGLNGLDASIAYENQLLMFSQSGVLVYHVNARIGKIEQVLQSDWKWDGYCYDQIPDAFESASSEAFYYYLYSNTRSYCYDTAMDDSEAAFYRGRLISLLPASGRRTSFTNRTMANNTALFQEGDSFLTDGGAFGGFIFDDGTKPAYGFKVEKEENGSATLRFKEVS